MLFRQTLAHLLDFTTVSLLLSFTYLYTSCARPQGPTLEKLAGHVSNVMRLQFNNIPTEDCIHHPMDTLVLDTMQLLDQLRCGPLLFTYSRNSVDSLSGSTQAKLRPDFVLWIRNALLFKGKPVEN